MVPNFDDITINDFFIPGTRQWDTELIQEVFGVEDFERILRTTPTPWVIGDNLIWHFDVKGKYTVKSAYYLAMQIIDGVHSYGETPQKLIWDFRVPPKIRIFYWRLCNG